MQVFYSSISTLLFFCVLLLVDLYFSFLEVSLLEQFQENNVLAKHSQSIYIVFAVYLLMLESCPVSLSRSFLIVFDPNIILIFMRHFFERCRTVWPLFASVSNTHNIVFEYSAFEEN
jgi:hypothetical protein